MPGKRRQRQQELPATKDIQLDKIGIFFKRQVLKKILSILLMEDGGYRTFKSVKSINRLFTNIDLSKYNSKPELITFIWCICYVSKQWLAGVISPEIIVEMMRSQPEWNNVTEKIVNECMAESDQVTPPEAKAVFDLVSEALQYGYIVSMKDKYSELLDDISLDEPGSYKTVVDRLFQISKSLLDIKHNTNMLSNKLEFNTADMDSVKEAVISTLESLRPENHIFITGIKRLNTLLSPGFMNGRLYCFLGLPSAGKSMMLLKMALDARRYNLNCKPKTPGMRPCVLYITMENTFTETLERLWNLMYDEPITNFSEEEATEKICEILGIKTDGAEEEKEEYTLLGKLSSNDNAKPNIEIVIQYYPYRSINTDDLYTIIQDLKDMNMEVDMLILDYIKRIEPAIPVPDNVKMELNRIMNELKALAVVQDIPVVTAHQMNRMAASTVDNAARQGKGDQVKLVGRENVGDAWEVIEASDWVAIINSEYKPGTDDKYLTVNVVKRRRVDSADAEFTKYQYLAHPFSKTNGFRLVDDYNLGKILSLQSLVSDLDMMGLSNDKVNAVPRLSKIIPSEFIED